MKLPKSWTTVTPFSRMLALILFISLPIFAFWFGTKYEEIKLKSQMAVVVSPTPAILPTSVPIPTPSSNNQLGLTWEECTKMRNSTIMQTYPPICVTSDGLRVTKPVRVLQPQ